MAERKRESEHYPAVERWLKRAHKCWETRINTGLRLGRIDVVGIRDIGGDLSGRSEVISVEVKGGNQPFATSAGQAHGYSVMADRCYLADVRSGSEPFDATEMLIADRLGIGLIALSSSGKIRTVLTAPPCRPVEELRLQVVEKLGLSLCSLCGVVFRRSKDTKANDFGRVSRTGSKPGALRKAVQSDRGLVWWLEESASERQQKQSDLTYWRRYACADCVSGLFRDLVPGAD